MCTTYQLRHTCGHYVTINFGRCQRAQQTNVPCRTTECAISPVMRMCPECVERAAAAANEQLLRKIEQHRRLQSAEMGQLGQLGQLGGGNEGLGGGVVSQDRGVVSQAGRNDPVFAQQCLQQQQSDAAGQYPQQPEEGRESEEEKRERRKSEARSVWDLFECDFCGQVCLCDKMFPGEED